VTVVTTIAQAVTDELNAATLSQPFTAERAYRPAFQLQDMKDLHVTVVPRAIEISAFDRGRCREDVQVDIAVQKKVASEEPAELDPLMALVQEIADLLRTKRLTGAPQAIWVKTENEPVYALEHLQEMRQFTSVLTTTYRIAR
jgi:hypothetical protein